MKSSLNSGVTAPQLYRLQACFGLGILVHLGNVPWWLLLAVAALVYWRWQIVRASVPLPSLFTRACLGAVLFLGVLAEFGTVAGRDSGTMLMIGLVAIKFLELRSTRDYMVISFVLYFMTLIALLFDQSIPVFLLVLVVMGLITANLVYYHSARQKRVWLPTRRLLRLTGLMLIQALPLALVLFIFFPRVQGKFGFNLGLAKSGLSQELEPGSISGLIFDDEMAFRVEFPPGSAKPPLQHMYWRAFVLWDVDARTNRWTMGRVRAERFALEGGTPLRQTITLPATGEKWLFALDHPTDRPPIEPTWLGRLRPGDVYEANRPVNRKMQYNVTSLIGANLVAVGGALSPDISEIALEITNRRLLNPRVVTLAESFQEKGGDAAGIVREMLSYFRTEGFRYTSLPGSYSEDMLADFLFERKTGYCEHYATAAGVLLRLAGVPSRLVIGYQGAEYNPYGDFYIVKQANAHVWVEGYVPEEGWVRIDPTVIVSPARIASGPQEVREEAGSSLTVEVAGQPIEINYGDWQPEWLEALLDEGDLRWQQVEEVWDRWILSYNPESQERLLSQVGVQRQLRGVVFVVASLLVAVATVALVWWWLRRPEKKLEPEQELWTQYQRLLAWAGVPRRRWEGPLDYAARVAQILPKVGESAQDFAETYVRLRYAPQTANRDAALSSLRASLEKIRQRLEKTPSQVEG